MKGYREIMGRVFKDDGMLMEDILATGKLDQTYGDLLTSYFLDLMYNIQFKYYFMHTYLRKYPGYVMDVVFEESPSAQLAKLAMEKFSAQVFNIPSFCTRACSESGLLQMLFKTCYDMLSRCCNGLPSVDTGYVMYYTSPPSPPDVRRLRTASTRPSSSTYIQHWVTRVLHHIC